MSNPTIFRLTAVLAGIAAAVNGSVEWMIVAALFLIAAELAEANV